MVFLLGASGPAELREVACDQPKKKEFFNFFPPSGLAPGDPLLPPGQGCEITKHLKLV
jgi:hypothetical protein